MTWNLWNTWTCDLGPLRMKIHLSWWVHLLSCLLPCPFLFGELIEYKKKKGGWAFRYATTMVKGRGRCCRFFFTNKSSETEGDVERGWIQVGCPSRSFPPSLVPSPSAGLLSSALDLPIFRLGLEWFPIAANRIRSTHGSGHSLWIWECYCSLAELWYFNYPTTRWPQSGPAGNKQGAGENFCLYMGIIPELLSRSACTKHWQPFWTLTARL